MDQLVKKTQIYLENFIYLNYHMIKKSLKVRRKCRLPFKSEPNNNQR